MAVLHGDYLKTHDCKTAGDAIQKQEGCYEPRPEKYRWFFEGHEFDRCPAYYIARAGSWIQEMFEIYAWAEKGLLPGPGTWNDQPNIVIEAINFIGYLMSKKLNTEKKNDGK